MPESGDVNRALVRSKQDFAGAIFLLLIAALALYQGSQLTFGTLRQIGPGLMPVSLAVILAGLAGFLLLDSLRKDGPGLGSVSIRAIIFVLGAFVVFGLSVRTLGLTIAGPLTIVIGGFASDETKFWETLIFGIVMTILCILIFRVGLNQPLAIAPWLPWLGY